MKILVDRGDANEPLDLSGDPMHIVDAATEYVRTAIYRGETVFLAPMEGPFDWCEKCELFTANHEPRLHQSTRYSKGYYTCPICGYTKEGVIPNGEDS